MFKTSSATFSVAVTGEDIAPLASFGPGEERFSYMCAGEDDTLVFSCTGAGSAAISDFVRGRGFGIILR